MYVFVVTVLYLLTLVFVDVVFSIRRADHAGSHSSSWARLLASYLSQLP